MFQHNFPVFCRGPLKKRPQFPSIFLLLCMVDTAVLRQMFVTRFISSLPSIQFNAVFLKLFLLLAALDVVTLMHKGPRFGAE
jgi:hypothetical protein